MTIFLRATTTIPTVSGLTANQVVWTTHWRNDTSGRDRQQDANTIVTRMTALLDHWVTVPAGQSFLHSGSLQHSGSVTQVFDLTEQRPRVPFHVVTHTAVANPPVTGGELPTEVAWCVSYQAARVSGTPQNRRRGRIYFGPFQVNEGTANADWQVPPNAAIDSHVNAVQVILSPVAGVEPRFCVLSRMIWGGLGVGERPPLNEATGERVFPEIPGNLPAAMAEVTQFWADNAWDTQRRRGILPTYRKNEAAGSNT